MLISPERTKKFINNRAFFTQNGKSKENETLELVQMEADKKEEPSPINDQFPSQFGVYEFFLLILTQCGYLPVAASLLSTTFFEPSKTFCNQILIQNQTQPIAFNSLLFQLIPSVNEACQRASTLNFYLTTSVMAGGIFGSFLTGFLADRFGRKPIVVGTLLVLAAANLLLLIAAHHGLPLILLVFFVKGCACGGYMVTNVVFILEAVKAERTRLLVASLNGWPVGMVFTGLVGWLCADWTWYSGCVAATAMILALLLQSRSFESTGWLDTKLKTTKAHKIRHRIHKQNQRLQLAGSRSLRSLNLSMNGSAKGVERNGSILEKEDLSAGGGRRNGGEKSPIKSSLSINTSPVKSTPNDGSLTSNDTQVTKTASNSSNHQAKASTPKNNQNATDLISGDEQTETTTPTIQPPSLDSSSSTGDERRQSVADILFNKGQNYLDLFKDERIRRPLCALLFSFMTSSVVSFGFYFTTDAMSGSRYVNLALMGALKFTLGLIPYGLSFMATKKCILLGSVGSACLACWTLAILCTCLGVVENPVATALGVAITASMDPTWKISHLYSVELFPTEVRNMARGVCNVTARLGSMAGPLIILFRSWSPLAPYWLFATLLTFQLLILCRYMPTNNKMDNGESESRQLPA